MVWMLNQPITQFPLSACHDVISCFLMSRSFLTMITWTRSEESLRVAADHLVYFSSGRRRWPIQCGNTWQLFLCVFTLIPLSSYFTDIMKLFVFKHFSAFLHNFSWRLFCSASCCSMVFNEKLNLRACLILKGNFICNYFITFKYYSDLSRPITFFIISFNYLISSNFRLLLLDECCLPVLGFTVAICCWIQKIFEMLCCYFNPPVQLVSSLSVLFIRAQFEQL